MKSFLRAIPIILIPLSATANDGFGALGVGGIVVGRTDKIAMAREVLDVSYSKISVSYEFINESDEDITDTVAFPLPPYPAAPNWSGIISQGEPLDFRIAVNGRPVHFVTVVRATHQGVDVTEKLKAIGLTETQIALMPFDQSLLREERELTIPKAQISRLREAGLLREEADVPDWDIHVAYQWKQTFPARNSLRVEHVYRPFVAEGTASGYEGHGDSVIADFCPNDGTIHKLDQLLGDKTKLDSHGQIPGTIVKYVLTTGNTWKDGIRDFTLRIHKSAPEELVSLCFPGAFRRVGSKTLETHMVNFKPTADLAIYFGNSTLPPLEPSALGVPPKIQN